MKTMFGILGMVALGASVTALTALHARTDDTAALVKALARSKHSIADGIKQVSKGAETAISAKFEFDDNGKLSLSVYAAEKGLTVDAEHNVLKEYGGSPEQAAWTPEVEVFKDVAHVARSAQQQTLMSLTTLSLLEIVAKAEKETKGQAFSITPTVDGHRAVFAVKCALGDKVVESKYGLFGDEDDEEHEEHEKKEKH